MQRGFSHLISFFNCEKNFSLFLSLQKMAPYTQINNRYYSMKMHIVSWFSILVWYSSDYILWEWNTIQFNLTTYLLLLLTTTILPTWTWAWVEFIKDEIYFKDLISCFCEQHIYKNPWTLEKKNNETIKKLVFASLLYIMISIKPRDKYLFMQNKIIFCNEIATSHKKLIFYSVYERKGQEIKIFIFSILYLHAY